MKSLAWVGLLSAAMALAACEDYGPKPPPPGAPVGEAVPTAAVAPSCFYTRDIRNHTIADDHTLYFDVLGLHVYRVRTTGCFAGATSSDPIITHSPPGTANVCRPIDLDLSISKGGAPVRCFIQSITPLSPAEVAALPPRLRP